MSPSHPLVPLPRIPTVVPSPPAISVLRPLCICWSRRGAPLWDAAALARSPRPPQRAEREPGHALPAPPLFVGSLGGGELSPLAPCAWWLRNSSPRSLCSRWPGPAPTGKHPKKGQKRKFGVKLARWGRPPSPLGRKEEEGGHQGKREEKGGAVRARGGGSALSRVGVGVGRAPWPAGPQPRGKYAGHVGGGAGRR